jgi:hypothetical protein
LVGCDRLEAPASRCDSDSDPARLQLIRLPPSPFSCQLPRPGALSRLLSENAARITLAQAVATVCTLLSASFALSAGGYTPVLVGARPYMLTPVANLVRWLYFLPAVDAIVDFGTQFDENLPASPLSWSPGTARSSPAASSTVGEPVWQQAQPRSSTGGATSLPDSARAYSSPSASPPRRLPSRVPQVNMLNALIGGAASEWGQGWSRAGGGRATSARMRGAAWLLLCLRWTAHP